MQLYVSLSLLLEISLNLNELVRDRILGGCRLYNEEGKHNRRGCQRDRGKTVHDTTRKRLQFILGSIEFMKSNL